MAYTTINKSTAHFNTKLYTGNGYNSTNITGVGHNPDLVWIKDKGDSENHWLQDNVRGIGKDLSSNDAGAEATNNFLLGTISDGFTLSNSQEVNQNSHNFVAWNWKANGAGSANTAGSINSTVSANTTAGFSIGTYTGNATNNATVGHGLSSAPQMIIVKQRGSGGDNWQVYWNDGTERNGFLNLTNGFNTPASTQLWGDNVPTSSVFTLGSDTSTNVAGNLVFYAFHSVQGYSKFGSYLGNSANDGTFVYTGFKPAFVIVKRTNSTGNWVMHDNKRSSSGGFNQNQYTLYSNTNTDQITDESAVDFISNGFKFRNAITDNNANGSAYIYMAFAEAPLVGTNNVPCTAR